MKATLLLLLTTLFFYSATSQENKLNIVVIGAHPDDCDIDAGGTAILFQEMGHNVLFVSLTNGDAGHFNTGGGALAKRRMAEAKEAGKRFGVTYKVLNHHDGELIPTLNNRLEVIRLIREWNADVVISHRPYDYHPDHRNAAIIVQDASFLVVVPNIVPDTSPLKESPVFLYSEDRFKKPTPFLPEIVIDISDVFSDKMYAMAAHKSQFFEWLPWLAGTLDEIPKTKKDQLAWLSGWRNRPISTEERAALYKWYGKEKGDKAQKIEAFEICEYGRQPSDSEIRQLFPMLGEQ